MAYEFKKLGEVELVEAASDAANVVVEDGGTIKRVPIGGFGGGGESWLIITRTRDDASSGWVYSANVTVEELMETMVAGNLFIAAILTRDDSLEYQPVKLEPADGTSWGDPLETGIYVYASDYTDRYWLKPDGTVVYQGAPS